MAGDSPIDPRALAAAEALLGLSFSEDERAQMARSFALVARVVEQVRAIEPPNSLGPATRFDPRLPGDPLPAGPARVERSHADPGPLPASDEDIAFAPVSTLSDWIERGDLTSERLTDLYLERMARLGPDLYCLVTLLEEPARAQARRADQELADGRRRGPLHGIPWGAKDLLDTSGVATSWGTAPYRGRVPKTDATVVQRLERAGAVLIAKLSLGELANGDVWFGGKTRNPWQPASGSGGSSAGSAAATAAGLVGFAIGSETLGSITSPCMVCGAVGLRPTFGRVPRGGAMTLCWSFDKLGPIARTVEDAVLVLDAIHGADPGDPDALDLPFGYDPGQGARGRRIGFVPQHYEDPALDPADHAVLDTLRELGAELVPVELPETPQLAVLLMIWVEAAAAFQELVRSGRVREMARQDDDSWPNLFRTAHLISAVDYVQCQRARRQLMGELRERFAGLDAIAAPGMGASLSFLTNASGHPSLTQRVGFRSDGTPIAVTLHGRLFDEGTLCAIGSDLERELDVWRRRPEPV
jgi:Asp-tRNA(Asn)/Glu-tRNA(Gln) amidotransferase A subunit family amidase